MSSLTHPHFSFDTNTMKNGIMPEATTILLVDDSLQAETLGDACLISILSTISSMLHLLLDMIPKQWIISTKEKFTTASIADEEPFNHCTENMEVFFQEPIGWITKLS